MVGHLKDILHMFDGERQHCGTLVYAAPVLDAKMDDWGYYLDLFIRIKKPSLFWNEYLTNTAIQVASKAHMV